MSLGRNAISVRAVVVIENAHQHLEVWSRRHPGQKLDGATHWHAIEEAAAEVGPALFFSLVIILLSFIPVFAPEAQKGALFAPLEFTKPSAMATTAGLAVTLVPVLMGYLIRGRIPWEEPAEPLPDPRPPAAARSC